MSASSALTLRLECVQTTIKAGTAPVLHLTVANDGAADERVLIPRGDLQDTFYDLVLTKDGKWIDMPRMISDSGPITDDDFLTLKPGESVTFEFKRYAAGVYFLPAGSYQAQIRFWQNPRDPYTTTVLSPMVTITIE
jgi:hypothetical protein